jgi:hypothetical protein
MAKKLQNIKALQQMLEGDHKFQTKTSVGFSDADSMAKKNEQHEVGDIWDEKDPTTGLIYTVEQKDGFRIKKSKLSDVFQEIRNEMRVFGKCPKETCTCSAPKRIDEKMRKIHNMCFDCVIDMEHQLKLNGEYEAYELEKVQANAIAWLESAEKDVEMLKQAYTEAMSFVSNSEGQTETWAAKMTPEEFEETVQSNFEKFKQNFLDNLNNTNINETTDDNN